MIYFIQDGPDGPIKIGTTIRLSERLNQLRKEHGPDLTVLAVLDGAYAEERALHERFSGSRLRGEWFVVSPELLNLIQTEGRWWDGNDEATKDVTLRVDAETAEAIRLAAAMKKVSIGDYLRAVMLPIARRDVMTEAKKITKGDKPE